MPGDWSNPWWVREDTAGADCLPTLRALEPIMHPLCFQDILEIGEGVRRRVVPAAKDAANPVFAPERPWEGKGVVYPSVIKEPDGRWRMWYPCRADGVSPVDGTEGYGIALAESDDGRTWRRPSLGRATYEGEADTNIACVVHGGAVCRDDAAPPDRRYRMFTVRMWKNTGTIYTLASPDGLDWRMMEDMLIPIRNDSQERGFRSPYDGKWYLYHRPGWCTREVAVSESIDADGTEFLKPKPCLRPDDIDRLNHQEHYAITVWPYDGGYIGFLRIYNKRWDNRLTWIEIVCSRDAYAWQRMPDRTPIIGLGPDGAWDSCMIAPSYGLVEDGGGHWFYYDSWNVPHYGGATIQPHSRCCVGRAFIPRRRLVECRAELADAWVQTRPLLLKGDVLKLDGDAGGATVRASIEHFDGSTPEGFSADDCTPLTGAFTEGAVAFKGGSLRQFGDRPVRIVLHMGHPASVWALGVI